MLNLTWDTVGSADAADPPDRPGLYAWMRDEEVVFVAPIPWRGDERGRAVDSWLRSCSVAWQAMLVCEARLQVGHLIEAELPLLHQWRPRPGEDEWLAGYLRRTPCGGVSYTEVPIGGGPGSSWRRIDAVRVCSDHPLDVRCFDPRRFERDVRGEILEVKASLNRPVVGQLLVARDLINRQWPEVSAVHLVAVVARDDALIHELCSEIFDIELRSSTPSVRRRGSERARAPGGRRALLRQSRWPVAEASCRKRSRTGRRADA